jgi:hypothetical protein
MPPYRKEAWVMSITKKWPRPALGLLGLLITILFLAIFAKEAPAMNGSPPAGGLTAIDVPLDSLPVLERLGIVHQDQPRSGVWRAAATTQQLTRLRQEGVDFLEAGHVALVQGGEGVSRSDPSSTVFCFGDNAGNYIIPYNDWPNNTWVYSPIFTNCALATTATITSIDIYYDVVHPYADTHLGLVFGSNSPSWLYTTLETFGVLCCSADADADGYAHYHIHADHHADPNAHHHADRDAHRHTAADAHPDTYIDAHYHADAHRHANAHHHLDAHHYADRHTHPTGRLPRPPDQRRLRDRPVTLAHRRPGRGVDAGAEQRVPCLARRTGQR